jgi:hypothetical protein
MNVSLWDPRTALEIALTAAYAAKGHRSSSLKIFQIFQLKAPVKLLTFFQ